MNDVTAISGSGQNTWPVSRQPVKPMVEEDIHVLDNQSGNSGEKNLPEQITRDDVEKSIEDMNKALSMLNRSLKFVVHEDTGKLMVQVIDKESGKVIKEIPPQILLDIEARIEKFLGILFDKKV